MNQNIVSAVFDSHDEAERAITELRSAGVQDSEISYIAKNSNTDGSGAGDNDHGGLVKGLLAGGGLGALAGIAALAIPGVGPFVAAGAIAETAIGGAAATGAAVGATAGGLSGALKDHGVSDDDAGYYEERINNGGVFVSVDTSNSSIQSQAAYDVLHRNGGHGAGRPKTTAV